MCHYISSNSGTSRQSFQDRICNSFNEKHLGWACLNTNFVLQNKIFFLIFYRFWFLFYACFVLICSIHFLIGNFLQIQNQHRYLFPSVHLSVVYSELIYLSTFKYRTQEQFVNKCFDHPVYNGDQKSLKMHALDFHKYLVKMAKTNSIPTTTKLYWVLHSDQTLMVLVFFLPWTQTVTFFLTHSCNLLNSNLKK